MTRFIVSLSIVAIAVWCVAWFGGWLNISVLPATLSEGILLFATLLIYVFSTRVDDAQRFAQVYLLSIVLKIFLACILIVVLILIDKPHARANVVFIFTAYVVFTITEVVFLIQLRSRHQGSKKNQKISF
jgi:glucan phosphoethanolaminetransferase (alkaline phosphatase superfamily)